MGIIGKTFRFTLGLALGAGIGSVVALFVAPLGGNISKEQLQQRANEIINAGKSAQGQREKELLNYWEKQISKA